MSNTTAWADVLGPLNERSHKPRSTGVTMVLDKCQGLNATADLLALTANYIDHWKLSFGTSALMEEALLRDKIALLTEQGILVYPGGTLAEYAILRGVGREYLRRARDLGFNGIEISDGTIHLRPEVRRDMIYRARDLGFRVVTEVGKKDPREQSPVEALTDQALADFEAGVAWVIVEAREAGKGVGVYDANGNVHEQDVDAFVFALNGHLPRLIWEAPLKHQQAHFILRFGPDVGLGNIPPCDVLALEALRAGLRFDTLRPQVERMEQEQVLALAGLPAQFVAV
jgi:phosphosulfolactate synthase